MSGKGTDEEKSEDETETDASLDLSSPQFEPLKALYSSEAKLPCRDAPVYDNITKFQLGPTGLVVRAPATKKIKDVTQQPSTSKMGLEEPTGAKSLTGKKLLRDVLSRMQDMKGPLALLKDCVERRVRIKVQTRGAAGIRGHCIAFVVAFDKMWNLALEDVREVWTRKIKRKTLSMGPPMQRPGTTERRVKAPKIVVTKLDRKTEKCERHVSQMLMRGEHVVLISLLD